MMNQPNKKAFEYACAILARRRYSVSEFRNKLEKKFPEQIEMVNEIVELFLTLKYLDDQEYARLYIGEQLRRKPQGLRMIQQKLRQKGINETVLSNAFSEAMVDEDELIRQALTKKLKTLKVKADGSDTKKTAMLKKQKLFRFLTSRGFSYERILKNLNAQEEVL